MRPTTRIAALALVLLSLVGASAASAKVGDLYAFRYGAHGNLLVPYDPVRLVPSGAAVPMGPFGYAWSVSPDRTHLVAAAGWRRTRGEPAALRFVALTSGRVEGTVSLPGELRRVAATAWVRGRVLAVVSGADATTVYSVDPAARAVIGKVELPGAVVSGERSRNGVALLLERDDVIGPATLAFVDQRPRARSVVLDRISVGTTVKGTGEDRQSTTRRPGLAIAPSGLQAFLFGAGEPAAAVDLRTLDVRYAPLRSLAAIRKQVSGAFWSAAALPDGRVVVSGFEYRKTGSGFLRVVDPRDWSSRVLVRTSSWFSVGGGMVFTRGAGDVGLRMWKPSGEAVDLFRTGSISAVEVVGPRAFVRFFGSGGKAAVVELGTGRVSRHTVPAHLLVGAGQRIDGS